MFGTYDTLNLLSCRSVLFALMMSCVCFVAAPSKADTHETRMLFDEALQANANFDNERLLEILSKKPEVLLERTNNGISLIEFAFFYLNEDLVSQTNFEFIRMLVNNDFFGQKVDRAEHFSFALQALHGADEQIGSIDLSDDMIVHNSREPFIALLSQTIADRVSQKPLGSKESLAVVLDICDPEAFEAGQERFFTKNLIHAVLSPLSPEHRALVEASLRTGIFLDVTCVDELLR